MKRFVPPRHYSCMKPRMMVVALCGIVLASPARAAVLVSADESAPIIVTLMTHTDGRNYSSGNTFLNDARRIRWGMGLYERLGAKMNLEASKEFADASVARDPTILRDAESRHGVGTHCNDAGALDDESVASLTARIAANKLAVDARLTNAANNASVSGICSRNDWVTASSKAGFKIVDAAVGYCYLSMSECARPADWTDEEIQLKYYHDAAPYGFENRMSPIRLRNSLDFIADAEAVAVQTLSNGELGELDSLFEGRNTCPCTLTVDDFGIVYAAIDYLIAHKAANEVGRINVHVPVSLLVPGNDGLLRSFLNGLKAKPIVFGTQKDVVDTYAVW